MKTFILLAATSLVLLISSCNQNSPAPSNSGSTNNTNNTNMTPLENSLVGSWKLKRTEYRSSTFSLGLGDSTFQYINHYNYYNSILEFTSTPSSMAGQYYSGVWGFKDNTPPQQNIAWKEGPNNSITIGSSQSFFIIKYLSTDSMILDFGGGTTITRFFFNKNTVTPKMNQIEQQLIGNPWQLISQNGQAPSYPIYKNFKSTWFNDNGYLLIDSFLFPPPNVTTVGPNPWEVLYPNRAIPILYFDNTTSGGFYKIITLTPNNLRIEGINPSSSSISTSTLIYSR